MISWHKFLENVIDDFKNQGFKFKNIGEMKIITQANKNDMSYDFYIKLICTRLSGKYLL